MATVVDDDDVNFLTKCMKIRSVRFARHENQVLNTYCVFIRLNEVILITGNEKAENTASRKLHENKSLALTYVYCCINTLVSSKDGNQQFL